MKIYKVVIILLAYLIQIYCRCPFHSLEAQDESVQAYVAQKIKTKDTIPGTKQGDHYAGKGYLERDQNLAAINSHFVSLYEEFLLPDKIDKVLFTCGSYVKLYKDGILIDKIKQPINMYHNLKGTAHIGLAIWTILNTSYQNNELQEKQIQALKGYQKQLSNLVINKELFIDQEQYNRNVQLVEDAKDFIENFLSNLEKYQNGTLNIKYNVQKYLDKINENTYRNLYDASMDQVDSTVKAVKQLKQQYLTEEEWDLSKVVISANHMSKTDYVVTQAFGYIYGIDNFNDPNEKIIVTENHQENDKLRASGAHNIDYLMGDMWFSDRYFMHKDALAPHTKEYIKTQPFGLNPVQSNNEEQNIIKQNVQNDFKQKSQSEFYIQQQSSVLKGISVTMTLLFILMLS